MTGSVADLLCRISAQVDQLYRERGLDPNWRALDRAWVPLARSFLRAFDTLNTASQGIRHAHALETALRHALPISPIGPPLLTHWKHSQLAETVGALADLLTTAPMPRLPVAGHAAEQVAGALAGYMARTAKASLRTIPAAQADARLARTLQRLAIAAPNQRAAQPNYLLDWRIAGPHDPGIDGPVRHWAVQAEQILNSPMNVTGLSLQLIAYDISLLCIAASILLDNPSNRSTEHEATIASQKARAAGRVWTLAASWPPNVRLGGRAMDLRQASTHLRRIITETFGLGSDGRRVNASHPFGDGLSLAVRTLSSAQEVGNRHLAVVTDLLGGCPALWVRAEDAGEGTAAISAQLRRRTTWRVASSELRAALPVLDASSAAVDALSEAWTMSLVASQAAPLTHSTSGGWETVTSTIASRHQVPPPDMSTPRRSLPI